MFRKITKQGFSLVELLVVITIIAILSVAAYSAVGGNTIKARDAKRKQDISTIQQALELFFAENSAYPATLTSAAIPKKYLSDIPKDPGTKKRDYQYTVSGSTYEIATTLEMDGAIANYEGYVVGNSDLPLAKTKNNLGKFKSGGILSICTNGFNIIKGKIGSANADDNCIPYDPNND